MFNKKGGPMKNAILILLFCASASVAQFSSTAYHIAPGASLPATCSPNSGDVWFKTSATIGMYQCLTANTWTAVGSGGGGLTLPGIQYAVLVDNGAGNLGGNVNFTYNTVTDLVSMVYSSQNNFRSTSIAATAPTATPVATGTGNLSIGTNTYCITFIMKRYPTDTTYADSNASSGTAVSETLCGATVSATVDVTHKQVNLTNIPLGPLGTAARQIYRESPDDPTNFWSLDCSAVLNDNTTTIYTDNIAYADTCNISPDFDSAQGNFIFDSSSSFNLQSLRINPETRSVYINAATNFGNSTGNDNTIVGSGGILNTLTTGPRNTAVGQNTCEGITTGSNNLCLGYHAGGTSAAGTSNQLFIETNDTFKTTPLIGGDFSARTLLFSDSASAFVSLKTTGAATGKTIVCADANGTLYRSSSGVACAN